MQTAPYTLAMPATRTTPVVFASPHSGREYPRVFKRATRLGNLALRSSEDAFIDLLFEAAPRYGAPLLYAGMPRAYLDLNRGPDELDPALIQGIGSGGLNPRISSGLGVIPRVVSGGRQIYRGKISLDEAQARIDQFWHPYHDQLRDLLCESDQQFGQAILVDCHSMPHEAIQTLSGQPDTLPEVVLGDRFGAAAGSDIVDQIEAMFQEAGLRVARNKPFAGAYIAQRYGRPSRNQHVVQIEIDRALYMNEAKVVPSKNFSQLKSLFDDIIAKITDIGREQLPLAAE